MAIIHQSCDHLLIIFDRKASIVELERGLIMPGAACVCYPLSWPMSNGVYLRLPVADRLVSILYSVDLVILSKDLLPAS